MIILRPVLQSDIERIAFLCNDRTISEYTLSVPFPYTIDDARHFYEHVCIPDRTFAICTDVDQTMMGIFAIIQRDTKRHWEAEAAFWMGAEYRNKGYMTEALKLGIQYIVAHMNIRRIVAFHDIHNPASGRVMEKAGMKYEGTLSSYFLKNGEFKDDCVHSYINENYRTE